MSEQSFEDRLFDLVCEGYAAKAEAHDALVVWNRIVDCGNAATSKDAFLRMFNKKSKFNRICQSLADMRSDGYESSHSITVDEILKDLEK